MIREFREFVMRGNVLDLAVAVIIGAAFVAIVNSLVNDIIMPLIGLLTGGINFNSLYINLSGRTFESYAAAREAGAAVIGYGAFIQAIISFLLIAFAVFMIVKAVNAANRSKAEAPAPPPPSKEEQLLTEIRDLLAARDRSF
jgi:large conductance mechanosensitive channel